MASTAASTIASITLTSGIQDISALLPLLGTEQCERHIGSALTEGYLYAAATPMSIFGSLGMASAGFKTCLACFSIPAWNIAGAQKLRDAGFEAKGTNFALITVDPDNKDRRYITETRLTSLLQDLHIEEGHKLTVQTYSLSWNVKMLGLTAFLCTLNVLPYIHLNIRGDSVFHPLVRWAFPIIRALGGFFTATTLQVIIQIRLSILIKKHLVFSQYKEFCENIYKECSTKSLEQYLLEVENEITKLIQNKENAHPEEGLESKKLKELKHELVNAEKNSMFIWPLLIILFISSSALVVGYVGCFSIVQSSQRPTAPVVWLGTEAALSLVRVVFWAWNPAQDDAEPMKFCFDLDPFPPLPTCNRSSDHIDYQKDLPVVRSSKFLRSITAYAGPIDRFDNPDISLYYTLTRKEPLLGVLQESSMKTRMANISMQQINLQLTQPLVF
ncbi:hypothetical protein PILCRDRAFT_4498 [Piloderma croceum F 1598]|uniref:Uncharacterized protein n=1 Tax=Piloderma croceum (strain F 1598) TaxID=765440 RepID=A0A0C3G3T6_PILCF|nr:hypothetical protein PILCRDRAFT_4498 [Piloderma croceum F 1598]